MSTANEDAPAATCSGGTPRSREVSCVPVYEMLSPLLGDPDLIPGTPVWCQLDDTDPAKWQAVLWAAVWWAVGQDARQATLTDAAHEIADITDWSAVAKNIRTGRGPAYIERRKEIA